MPLHSWGSFIGLVLNSINYSKKCGLIRLCLKGSTFKVALLFRVGSHDVNVTPANSCALKCIELSRVPYRNKLNLWLFQNTHTSVASVFSFLAANEISDCRKSDVLNSSHSKKRLLMDNVKFFVILKISSADTSVMRSHVMMSSSPLINLTNAVGFFTEGIRLANKFRIFSPPVQIS